MQIDSLKVFCDLVETESFTKTAQINSVTQSAVSQTISSLERVFKSLLIERSKKNFRLTLEGQILYDSSKQILSSYDALHSRLQDIKQIISGNIRVATVYSIGLHVLPPYIKKFLKTYPSVNVHVEYRRPDLVYEDVLGNVVDLGMVAYPARDPRLEAIEIMKDPLAVICHPQHTLTKAKAVSLKSIAGMKFVGFAREIPTRKAVDRIFKEHHVSVNYTMEFDNIETVKRAVEIDSGISIVPLETVRQEVANHTLVALKIDDGEFFRTLAVIHKRDKVLSPAMKQFIGLLKQPA